MKTMTKFEKETRHRLYVFIKKKTVDSAKCGTTARAHDAFCPPTHAWRVNCPFNCPIHSPSTSMTHHCPISAQIGLVITNHVREFHYGFDQYFHCFCFIPPWVPFIIPRKAFKGTCLHNDWIAKIRSSTFHRGKKGQSHWKIIFFFVIWKRKSKMDKSHLRLIKEYGSTFNSSAYFFHWEDKKHR